jgi:hypothetical protein
LEELWYLSTGPHGVTTEKTDIDIFTAARTSNLQKPEFHRTFFVLWTDGQTDHPLG